MTWKWSPKGSRGTNVEIFSLKMKSPFVCCWNHPRIEKEMFSLVSTGLTLLPARRKGKERASLVNAAFMVPCEVCPGRIVSVILIG